jgi:hypothetical protein
MEEDLGIKQLKQEIAQNDFNLDVQKNDFAHNKVMQKVDMLACKQEMVRRGIETLIGVLRTEQTSRTGTSYLESDIRKNAEKKLNQFINALALPEA